MSAAEHQGEIIQYVPFTSFVHPSFWHTLTELKLDVDKLNESTKQVFGRFTYRDDIGPIFEVDGTSFNRAPEDEQFYENVTGTILNKNTIEDFKDIDKVALINSVGEMIWSDAKKKNWIKAPSTLLNFLILSFADLKKFHYFYWFAFPAPSQPTVHMTEKSIPISSQFSGQQLTQIYKQHKNLPSAQKYFFIITKENDSAVIKTLAQIVDPNILVQENLCCDFSDTYFGFIDPSKTQNPGWPLRLFLAALIEHCPCVASKTIKVVGLRYNVSGSIDNSKIFTINIPKNVQAVESAGWVGWERNDKGNFGPKLANMSASMDPVKLADTSADLNIKLMKWRLAPDLNMDVMKETKCLLLGAGTLGCHVARGLLAWGFRHITFIDNGKVSFSNPTRQVLFNFQDCLGGGRKKAEAAADNLRLILPTVKSEGFALHIPMPGHPVGESLRDETMKSIDKITDAISNHDVIFLLLDTREARWLPTLIAAHYGKIVINAALGFDSYLVMRHGVTSDIPHEAYITKSYIQGSELGCYYCNDVTAPGNSLKDRTLDQQCTVTRPGVAAIAGALAVELLVALLQHPLRVKAPAIYNLTKELEKGLESEMQGVLGPIPHSIRGFLHSFEQVLPTCAKFSQCIACSDAVINRYRVEGKEFLLKVFNSGNYLEEVTGLSELHLAAEMNDVLAFSDEDSDE